MYRQMAKMHRFLSILVYERVYITHHWWCRAPPLLCRTRHHCPRCC